MVARIFAISIGVGGQHLYAECDHSEGNLLNPRFVKDSTHSSLLKSSCSVVGTLFAPTSGDEAYSRLHVQLLYSIDTVDFTQRYIIVRQRVLQAAYIGL